MKGGVANKKEILVFNAYLTSHLGEPCHIFFFMLKPYRLFSHASFDHGGTGIENQFESTW